MQKRAWVCAAHWLLLIAFSREVGAAGPQPQFPFTDAQIKALGIALTPISKVETAAGQSYPATVQLAPNAEQIVSSPVAGLVTQVAVRENDQVKRGQALASLISPELGPMQLQLLQAAARARLARQTAQRERTLHAEGIIPLRRVQEANAQLAEAAAAVNQARSALLLAGMARGDVERVEKTGRPENTLSLRAVTAGTVVGLDAKPGQRVAAASPLLTIANTATLWLEVHAPMDAARAWPKGTALRVEGRNIEARVTSAGSRVDAATQTVAVRAAVAGAGNLLRPGEAVKVVAPVPNADNAWDIPVVALARDGATAVVFVRTRQGFEARPVGVIATAGQSARVRGRLMAGERIATAGVVALKAAWLGEGGE